MPRPVCIVALAITALTPAARAQGVYFSTESVLKEFFAASAKVSYVRVDGHAPAVIAALGYRPAKQTYVIFEGRSGGQLDGYAIIDDEIGQHLPITFATKLTTDGTVERVEVMAYREGYGDEVREGRFRRQFVGKRSSDSLRVGDDIVAITGATISSRSMAAAVKRAAALVRVHRGDGN